MAAALAAGYAPSGAAITASRLLRDDRVLALIVAEIVRRAPHCEEAKRRLLMPSRPTELSARFRMLLAAEGGDVRVVGPAGSPAIVCDPNDAALRRFVARLSNS